MPEENNTGNLTFPYSEQTQEIIGRPPSWIVRWGITVFFCVLLLVLTLSWTIKYPEVTVVSFQLATFGRTQVIKSLMEGSIDQLFVKDGDTVTNGQNLCSIVNASSSSSAQLLKATGAGVIHFSWKASKDQSVNAGETLFHIVQPGSAYTGYIPVCQADIGRIKTGQILIIRIDGYPSGAYGVLKGSVDHIYSLPKDSCYVAAISLTDGLRTNTGITLPFREGMTGSAEVIIHQTRLIKKFLPFLN